MLSKEVRDGIEAEIERLTAERDEARDLCEALADDTRALRLAAEAYFEAP